MLVAGHVGVAPERPEAPTLIFDGSCEFCCRWVKRAKRLDRRDVVRVIPLQEPEAVRLSGQSVEHLRQAAHFVREDGLVFAGAAAGRELARFLPGGRIVRAVAVLPGVMLLAERTYCWIARTWGPVPK